VIRIFTNQVRMKRKVDRSRTKRNYLIFRERIIILCLVWQRWRSLEWSKKNSQNTLRFSVFSWNQRATMKSNSSKETILWRSFKFCELFRESKCTRFISERIKKLSSTILAFLTISNQTMMLRERKTSSRRKNTSRISSINLLSFSFQNFLNWQKKRD
jgi:hypothetical protein